MPPNTAELASLAVTQTGDVRARRVQLACAQTGGELGDCWRGNGLLLPFQQLKPQDKDINRTSPLFHQRHGRQQCQ